MVRLGQAAVCVACGTVTREGDWCCAAPVAAELPDGTPHPDPFLAGRGWIAWHGVYVRAGGGERAA